ncbi:MAG: molybdenum ABC transporter ATP-binding protein [Gammaproteobacteria bacterium]|nr:MAG: molybdenum ABC transporter ATP-binding protein [Gammaproteobacteria bacterium]RLA55997.1 MAG: molybdenum ABC transporter ATP-binding protein [Gammaproteobacteria bacterium]
MSSLKLSIVYPGDQGFELRLDCELPARGITAVYGPSGSGKSTLLDCIAGLRRPNPGSILRFRDETWQDMRQFTAPWERRIGYVFQDARLFPHLNVQQNLDYAMTRRSQPGDISLDKVVKWLELTDLLTRTPGGLSAGQKQRVAIGRALLCAPRLLLLDEPLANLDHAASQQCLGYLQRLGAELDLPMLYVSHDIEEVSQLADYLVLMDQGQLVDKGPLLELCSRLDTRLSHEEQAAAITVATIARHDTKYGLTELNLEGQPLFVSHLPHVPGQRRRVRIPARDVSVCRQRPRDSSILNILPVTLSELEASDYKTSDYKKSGDARILLRLSLGSQYLLARITRKSAAELQLKVGDQLFAQIKSAALLMEAADQP